MALLEIKDITKSFGETQVLSGISFNMEKGEVIAVIGSSGSGKTTLLRCINFLEQPDGGTITVNGAEIYNAEKKYLYSDGDIRKNRLNFGLVFQSFNLFPQYNVLKNITLAPELMRLKGVSSGAEKKEIREQIES